MSIFNWQQSDWPYFTYNLEKMHAVLLGISEKAGLIQGKLAHIDKANQEEALISLLLEEAVKTSEIEGEYISRPDVRSSIKNKLGIGEHKTRVHDKRVQGVVDICWMREQCMRHP